MKELDDFFCAQYCDYVKICAVEGYKMPEMVVIDPDGNIGRRDQKFMRLCYQKESAVLLARFKAGLADTEFTFDFSYPTLREALGDKFRKQTFAKYLPEVLKRYNETPESVGKKLTLEDVIWRGIVRGKLYPEKNVVMALALVCRMQAADINALFSLCGFELKQDNVRDVVFEYLVRQKIFNEAMRDLCLREYSIDTLPIRRDGSAALRIE